MAAPRSFTLVFLMAFGLIWMLDMTTALTTTTANPTTTNSPTTTAAATTVATTTTTASPTTTTTQATTPPATTTTTPPTTTTTATTTTTKPPLNFLEQLFRLSLLTGEGFSDTLEDFSEGGYLAAFYNPYFFLLND